MRQRLDIPEASPWQIDILSNQAASDLRILNTTFHQNYKRTSIDYSNNLLVSNLLARKATEYLEAARNLSLEKVVAKLHHGYEHIGRFVLGFDQPIQQSKLALATGNHHMLIGPTGVGKTFFAMGVRGLLADEIAQYTNQFSLETTEDALYGMIPMPRITEGTGCRNLEGSFALSEFAVIDEVFDARNALLRSMLWPLSDRLYRNGNHTVNTPLHSVIACGNYVRVEEKTDAFLDRFLFQSKISGQLSPIERQALLRFQSAERTMPRLPEEERLNNAEMRYLSLAIDGKLPGIQVVLPPVVTMLIDAVVTSYEQRLKSVYGGDNLNLGDDHNAVSSRNLRQLSRVVSAHALLDGRTTADIKDLTSLALTMPQLAQKGAASAFNEAWKEIMLHATPGELNALSTLSDLNNIIDQVDQGRLLKPLTIPEHIMKFLRLRSERDLSFGHLRQAVQALKPNLPYATAYQRALLGCIDRTNKRLGRQEKDPIISE